MGIPLLQNPCVMKWLASKCRENREDDNVNCLQSEHGPQAPSEDPPAALEENPPVKENNRKSDAGR